MRAQPSRLRSRLFTPREIEFCQQQKNSLPHFAARFAAKEAVWKALGVGWQKGTTWKDIEILPNRSGEPEVRLTGVTEKFFRQKGARKIFLSLTHTAEHSIAMVVLEG